MNTLLYIDIPQKIIVSHSKILIKEVIPFHSNNSSFNKTFGDTVLLDINENNSIYNFSILRLVEIATKLCPDVEIINLGESDFFIEYLPASKKSLLAENLKLIFVVLILFFGAGFTIMTFNQDISVADLFNKLYTLCGIEEPSPVKVIELSYSIGIFIGVTVFFNHFNKKKTQKDLTPIQIAMRDYEEDLNNSIIANAQKTNNVRKMR